MTHVKRSLWRDHCVCDVASGKWIFARKKKIKIPNRIDSSHNMVRSLLRTINYFGKSENVTMCECVSKRCSWVRVFKNGVTAYDEMNRYSRANEPVLDYLKHKHHHQMSLLWTHELTDNEYTLTININIDQCDTYTELYALRNERKRNMNTNRQPNVCQRYDIQCNFHFVANTSAVIGRDDTMRWVVFSSHQPATHLILKIVFFSFACDCVLCSMRRKDITSIVCSFPYHLRLVWRKFP